MSSSKQHLKQLLNEDQEPFVLKNYIHQQRSLLNKLPRVQKVKKQNSIRENLCKNVCFFSLQNSSPIGTKSPLFDFSESQTKTPSCSRNSNFNNNTVFVHIPAGTAALLLEAAIRIQNQSEKQKAAAASKNNGFFGSILKRLRRRKKNDFEKDNEIKVCVRDILRWESQDVCRNASEEKTEQDQQDDEEDEDKEKRENEGLGYEDKRVSDVGLSSSSGWTESLGAKSIDLETSTSSDEEQDAESSCAQVNGDFYLCEKGSPFRFLLDTVLSPRRRSPEFVSPATSPNRRKSQVENNVEGNFKKSDGQEEEKEYCSPVSVLEIQLDDNVDEQDEEEEYEDDSELERSFAFVHKAKQKLLQKLRRFERLAGLDPLDLEKRLTEDEDSNDEDGADEDVDDDEEEENYEEEESALNSNGKRSPEDMKKLLLHLMNEEGAVSGTSVGNKRCKRLGSLRNAERNMVNMMVEMDFRVEQKEWQRNSEHVEETVVAIEFGIFDFLVEELSVELVES